MITRKQAQEISLKSIEEEMRRENKTLDDICMMSPRRGKCSWTFREYKEAIMEDKPLAGLENETNETPIDEILNLEKYLNEKGKSLLKNGDAAQ